MQDYSLFEAHRHSNTTNMAVVHRSEPPYPAMTAKKSLMQGLLTRIGTYCVFWKERVVPNRLYLGEGSMRLQQTANESALFALQAWLSFMHGYS